MTNKRFSGFVFIFFLFWGCKKKTDLTFKVFNPYIQEYVAGARIEIEELHRTNFFTSGWGKQYDKVRQVAEGSTDANGMLVFNDQKLRSSGKYDYGFRLLEIWGTAPDDDPAAGFVIKKGQSNTIHVTDKTKGGASISFSGLFVPASAGDSISILPTWDAQYDPFSGTYVKGSGLNDVRLAFNENSMLPPDYKITTPPNQVSGKAVLTIRKRKSGVITTSTLSVQFRPRQTVVIPVSW